MEAGLEAKHTPKQQSYFSFQMSSWKTFFIQVQLCSHLGQRAGPPDTILEEDHPMTILSKFGSIQEDFYVNFP
jgi:hypothetical protein